MKRINDYLCTDPATLQYCKKLNSNTYLYVQFNDFDYSDEFDRIKEDESLLKEFFSEDKFWIKATIDIREYTDKEITDYIKSYGYTLKNIKEIYPIEWEQIIAESIFETDLYEFK